MEIGIHRSKLVGNEKSKESAKITNAFCFRFIAITKNHRETLQHM